MNIVYNIDKNSDKYFLSTNVISSISRMNFLKSLFKKKKELFKKSNSKMLAVIVNNTFQ